MGSLKGTVDIWDISIYTLMYTTMYFIKMEGKTMKSMYIMEPGKIEFREMPMPVRKKGEVLLKLLYGGICGSDLGSYKGTFAYFEYPRIPGHEFSAEIVEADENNEYGLKPGMIVTCNPYFNCGHCYSCSHGLVNA